MMSPELGAMVVQQQLPMQPQQQLPPGYAPQVMPPQQHAAMQPGSLPQGLAPQPGAMPYGAGSLPPGLAPQGYTRRPACCEGVCGGRGDGESGGGGPHIFEGRQGRGGARGRHGRRDRL